MKKHIINLVKGIIVLAVFTAALLVVSRIFTLKSEDGYAQIRSMYRQKENSIDVLFLGSSRVYCGVDTGILWDDYGIAAFDLGGAEAPAWNSYYYLREALKTQKPKLIIYDAAILGVRRDVLYQAENWVITNTYGMKWNDNRINLLKDNAETPAQFKRLLFPLDNMHSRYNDLNENDFTDKHSSVNYKGFDFRDMVVPFEQPDVDGIDEILKLNEKHTDYFQKIINLTKSYNIPLIVVISPFYVSGEDMMYFNCLKKICEDENITYINFNNKYDELGFDFETDMADENHLNFSGTKKYSHYFGTFIKDNYDIPDRRTDSAYTSWAIAAAPDRRNRLAYDVNNAPDDEAFSELIKDKMYVVFNDESGNMIVTNGDSVLIDSDKGELNIGDVKLMFNVNDDGIGNLYINDKSYSLKNGRTIIYDTILGKVIYNRSK